MLSYLPLKSLFSRNLKWLEQQQNSILSAAVIISGANLISSFAGIIRTRLLISYFGAGPTQEAYQLAFQIPDLMFQLIVMGALSAAFIPIFVKLKQQDEQKAFQMSSVILNIMVLFFITIAAIIFIFAGEITKFRTGARFTPEQLEITTNLTRIMLGTQILFAISNIFGAVLQSYQRFIIPSIAPILYNFGIVLGVYLFAGQYGIYAAGIGGVIGAFFHMLVQAPLAFKFGFRFKFSLNLKTEGVKELLKMAPPRVLSIGIDQLQDLSLGFFATSIGNLSFLVMTYSLTLMTLPIRFFGTPIGQASLPFLSQKAQEKDFTQFRQLVMQSLHQISFFALPASVMILILRVPIVRIAFGARELPWVTTVMIGRTVAIIAISIAAQAMVQLLIRSFYALGDTKTPFYITICTVFFYLAGSSAATFYTSYGVYALAGVTSITALLELFLFMILLHRRVGGFLTSEFWTPQLKMFAASFFMAVFLYLPYRIFDELIFDTTRTIELIALTITTGTIGMLVYVLFAILLNVRELKLLTHFVPTFNQSRQNLSQAPEVVVETHGEDTTI